MTHGQSKKRGFTLVELIIVITILVVLGVVVIALIDPAEILAQSRDAQRISDLATLKGAIQLVLSNTTPSTTYCQGTAAPNTAGNIFVSTGTAVGGSGYNVTAVATSTLQSADGTGWVRMNFTGLSSGSAIAALPRDPTNVYTTANTNGLYYRWGCNNNTGRYEYEVDAALESAKYKPGCTASNCEDKGTLDGGNSNATVSPTGLNDRYEQGNNLNVLPAAAANN